MSLVKVRPSFGETFLTCAGAAVPTNNPVNENTEAARKGRVCHVFGERVVDHKYHGTDGRPLIPDADIERECNKEQVPDAVDEVRMFIDRACSAWKHITDNYPKDDFGHAIPESKRHEFWRSAKPEVRLEGTLSEGTADVVCFDKHRLIIIDWKSGRVQYNASTQGKMYLCLAREKYGHFEKYSFIEVWTHPSHKGGNLVARDYGDEDLDDFIDVFQQQMKNITEKGGEIVAKQYAPGPACTYCPRQDECQARINRGTAIARWATGNKELTSVLTPELVAKHRDEVKLLKGFCAAWDRAESALVEETGGIPLSNGRRLINKPYKEKKIDPLAFWSICENYVALDDVRRAINITKKTVTDTIKNMAPTKAEGTKRVKEFLAELDNIGGFIPIERKRKTEVDA